MTIPVIERRKPLTRNQRAAMHDAHGSKCVVCLEPIPAGEPFIDEHVIPLGLGGTNDMSNRGPAHVGCAKKKTQRDLKILAKAKRVRARHLGLKKRGGRKIPGSKGTGWRKPINGPAYRVHE